MNNTTNIRPIAIVSNVVSTFKYKANIVNFATTITIDLSVYRHLPFDLAIAMALFNQYDIYGCEIITSDDYQTFNVSAYMYSVNPISFKMTPMIQL